MTDLPDAVVEAAAEASHIAYEDAALEHGWETQERSRVPWADVPEENKATVRVAIRAALAAASGPWAEQLDAANPTSDCTCGHPRWDHFRSTGQCAESGCGCFPFTPVTVPSPLQRQLDAALARNAESYEDGYNQGHADAHADGAAPDRLCALRAELDNLRETLAQKIENAGHKITKWLEDDTLRLNVENAYQDATAIVRGSDDEAKP